MFLATIKRHNDNQNNDFGQKNGGEVVEILHFMNVFSFRSAKCFLMPFLYIVVVGFAPRQFLGLPEKINIHNKIY
ncbi:hypothetical protein B6U81_01065 [Thermoplasmatales archaeon ex4484_30]|nr:MAG: hypothetical protein B6U81_01065 [Thermoplasmatales archaeon ex4484_30]